MTEMRRKAKIDTTLDYLKNKPIRIVYKLKTPGELHPCQMSDIIFDEYDLRIRRLNTEDNLRYLNEVQR